MSRGDRDYRDQVSLTLNCAIARVVWAQTVTLIWYLQRKHLCSRLQYLHLYSVFTLRGLAGKYKAKEKAAAWLGAWIQSHGRHEGDKSMTL